MNGTQSGQISILLPTYNGSRSIVGAIESVLAQDFSNFELMIIDDGSTDNTYSVGESFLKNDVRLRYLRNERNIGIQKSLNRGLREAQGIFIARIDDDDKWIDLQKLEKQVQFLEAHPDHALVGTGAILVDEKGNEIGRKRMPETDGAIRARLLGRNCFFHSSVLFRKDIALRCGGYEETSDTRHVEDYDLWLKIGLTHKLANLPFIGVKHAVRAGGLSEKNLTTQLAHSLKLSWKYRTRYPYFFMGLVRQVARLAAYGYLRIPTSLSPALFP